MKIFLGIIYLLLGFCSLIIAFSIDFDANLKHKIICCGLALCAGILWGLSFVCFATSVKDYSYPAKEYRLSIKTTTMDDKIDTTYVITEIR